MSTFLFKGVMTMGISIDVSNKQDYSYLFQSMSSSSGGMGNLNFLSDYASIRNGSYGKLLKTYYNKAKDSGTEAVVKAVQGVSLTKFWKKRKTRRFPKMCRRQTRI